MSAGPSSQLASLAGVTRLGGAVRGRLAVAILAGVGAAISAVALTGTSAWLISRASQQPPVLDLMVAIVAVRAFGVSRGALRYVERLAAHDAALRVLAGLRGRVYRRLERLAPAGLAPERSGDLLARVVADVDALVDLWPRVILPYLIAVVVAGGAVVVVGALVPLAGAALAVTLVVGAVAAPLAGAAVAGRAEARIAPLRGELSAAALDVLAGAQELVVAGVAERQLGTIAALGEELQRAEARSAVGTGAGALIATASAGAAVWVAVVAGIGALRGGSLDGVALAVLALLPVAAHELVASLAPAAQQLGRLRTTAGRLSAVLERPDPVTEPSAPAALPDGPNGRYGLRICGLGVRYRAGDPEVLAGIDLGLPAGGRALVTGPSGSGKSTLAAVLMRLLEPDRGTVELTGPSGSVDITALDGDEVRRVVGLCAQDAHIFDSTIAENVRLARPGASDEELRAALGAARLLDWVDGLPHGIDTFVGQHGAALSGGQRQRIELARTLLADRPVVIFDEPTEHLDEPTAAALTVDLLAAAVGRTVLFITHRPELMLAVEPDAVLDLGRGLPGDRHPGDDPADERQPALDRPLTARV